MASKEHSGVGEGLDHTCCLPWRREENYLDQSLPSDSGEKSNKISQLTSKRVLALQLKFTALKSTFFSKKQ